MFLAIFVIAIIYYSFASFRSEVYLFTVAFHSIPVVTLQKFGTYSLDFEIKGTVGDIFYGVLVASDLRFAILKAFSEKGIVIPQPSLVSVTR